MDMITDPITARLGAVGIIPVLRITRAEDAVPLAQALAAGGVAVAEVTLRTGCAVEAVRAMRRAAPEVLVGAGAVLTAQQADEALAAWAQFLVSPGLDEGLVRHSQERGVPIYPGCTTATDYQAALRRGLGVVKFFPAASSGGLEKIKALAAPFPMLRVMPTGGISLENLGQYLACPAVCACGGSFMAPDRFVAAGRWEEITALCRQAREIAEEVRSRG